MGIDIIIWIAACVFCLIVLILLWHDGIFDYVDDGCDEAMAGAIETLKKKKEDNMTDIELEVDTKVDREEAWT